MRRCGVAFVAMVTAVCGPRDDTRHLPIDSAVSVSRSTGQASAAPSVQFQEVWRAGVADEVTSVDFTYQGQRYHLSGDSLPNTAVNTLSLRIEMPPDFIIERVRVGKLRNDLIVLADMTDSEVGNGLLARFDSSRTRKWQHTIRAFNLADPTVHEEAAFVSGIGYVSKVDLSNGRPLWTHSELYDTESGAFNSFQPARLAGDTVIFQDQRSARSVRVLHPDGTIIAR